MSKFATILLKIIMVISFVGVIVFVAFAIINNHNITFEAYNYVTSSYKDLNFEEFSNNVKTNMKSKYYEDGEPYTEEDSMYGSLARYIDNAIIELNKANKYFLNYLSTEKDLTKGEQDKLKNLFSEYKSKYSIAKAAYNDYMSSYSTAHDKVQNDYDHSSVAVSYVISQYADFIEKYTDLYVSGSNFFRYLIEIFNKYSLQNSSNFSYSEQIFIIKLSLADHSTNFIFNTMKNKKNNVEYEKNARNNDFVDSFYDVLERENNFKEENFNTNSNFQEYVLNLNYLDIYKWAGDYENYKNSLKINEMKNKCENTREFFVLNFRG